MAMVGGGGGSFIGPVHRMAAELDGEIELVAGAFSSDPEKSVAAGRSYGLNAERVYSSYQQMLVSERRREDAADFVAIVTPNDLHFPIASAALESGFHVISDKPATATLREALQLKEVIDRTGQLYALTYTYTGYPLVREAREICNSGALGAIRKIVVEYAQGWLSERLELTKQKQAEWRADPARAGVGGCVADIGVHAFNLLEFVSGRRVVELCADLSSIVPGRVLDDDCNVLLRLDNGATGVLHATQIAAGERNGLILRIYGEKAALTWSQEEPNRLQLAWPNKATEVLHAGGNYLHTSALAATRLPQGHPEGYIEAFANTYRDFCAALRARAVDPAAQPASTLNGIADGIRGMAFIEVAVSNSRARRGWTSLAEPTIGTA